jgi:tetratricopeptide (TPR) repeat protein
VAEQLSLFGGENTAYNRAMGHLLDLRFAEAVTAFMGYARSFPWGRGVDREIAMAEFWMTRTGAGAWNPARAEDPEAVLRLWLEFEEAFGHPWDRDGMEAGLQKAVFSRLAAGLAGRDGDMGHALSNGTPVGLIFLRAGWMEEAVFRLQALVRAEPEHARGYGYLGDALMGRSDRERAMTCYHRSLALDPEALDRDHLLCADLARELKDFGSRPGQGGDRDPAWFPAVARLEGVFHPLRARDLDEMRLWHARFQRLVHGGGPLERARRDPGIFVHGMVLSDNASLAAHVPGLDIVEVRKVMRRIDEDLFLRHMEQLRAEESSGPDQGGHASRLRRA